MWISKKEEAAKRNADYLKRILEASDNGETKVVKELTKKLVANNESICYDLVKFLVLNSLDLSMEMLMKKYPEITSKFRQAFLSHGLKRGLLEKGVVELDKHFETEKKFFGVLCEPTAGYEYKYAEEDFDVLLGHEVKRMEWYKGKGYGGLIGVTTGELIEVGVLIGVAHRGGDVVNKFIEVVVDSMPAEELLNYVSAQDKQASADYGEDFFGSSYGAKYKSIQDKEQQNLEVAYKGLAKHPKIVAESFRIGYDKILKYADVSKMIGEHPDLFSV